MPTLSDHFPPPPPSRNTHIQSPNHTPWRRMRVVSDLCDTKNKERRRRVPNLATVGRRARRSRADALQHRTKRRVGDVVGIWMVRACGILYAKHRLKSQRRPSPAFRHSQTSTYPIKDPDLRSKWHPHIGPAELPPKAAEGGHVLKNAVDGRRTQSEAIVESPRLAKKRRGSAISVVGTELRLWVGRQCVWKVGWEREL
jgi:hypothetical protein